MKLTAITLFRGLPSGDITRMEQSHCLRQKHFSRRETIFHAGQTVHEIGIVLSGSVHIESVDPWGGKSLLGETGPGQAFAEAYAFCAEPLLVDAVAAEDCEILFLDLAALSRSHKNEPWREQLLHNLLQTAMHKNLLLSRRSFCTTPKTVRGRLLIYLSGQAVRTGKTDFEIPFDRQQLADHLNLDRSALSKELGRMRDEGLIAFRKNHFTLLQPQELP